MANEGCVPGNHHLSANRVSSWRDKPKFCAIVSLLRSSCSFEQRGQASATDLNATANRSAAGQQGGESVMILSNRRSANFARGGANQAEASCIKMCIRDRARHVAAETDRGDQIGQQGAGVFRQLGIPVQADVDQQGDDPGRGNGQRQQRHRQERAAQALSLIHI